MCYNVGVHKVSKVFSTKLKMILLTRLLLRRMTFLPHSVYSSIHHKAIQEMLNNKQCFSIKVRLYKHLYAFDIIYFIILTRLSLPHLDFPK